MVLKPNKQYGMFKSFCLKTTNLSMADGRTDGQAIIDINEVDSSSWMTFASHTISLVREQETDLFEDILLH